MPADGRPGIRAIRKLLRHRLGMTGLAILLVYGAVALLAPLLAPFDPDDVNLRAVARAPNLTHWLGTDQFGRDILSRILHGARVSLGVAVGAMLLSVTLGTALGVFAGYAGGRADEVTMRLMDALMAMPTLLKALLIVTVLGPSAVNAMIAVGIAFAPSLARVARGSTLAIRNSDFVAAAVARGEGTLHILLREITPNVLAPVIVESSIRVAFAIMIGATLGFLGLGAQPPTPEWGRTIAESREFLPMAWWYATFPGLAIFVVVMGFNLLGDGLRDVLDPRLRRAADGR